MTLMVTVAPQVVPEDDVTTVLLLHRLVKTELLVDKLAEVEELFVEAATIPKQEHALESLEG